MADRHECDRCHRIFEDKLESIQFYWDWMHNTIDIELCPDCIGGAKKWLKQYLKN
jgi:hypothetical protein